MHWKAVGLYFVGISALIAGLIVVSQPKIDLTSSFKPTDTNRPIVTAGITETDLGTMTTKDIRRTTFTIQNDGQSELKLTRVSTSCDCTYAYVTIEGLKSEKFTMHSSSPWVGTVAPNQTATLEVVYEPAIMPVKGFVERQITIATNDPNQPVLSFAVTATVSE